MVRRFIWSISLIVALIGSNASSLFAQESSRQNATVPFDFVFEDTRLPAGSYYIELMGSGMVVLLNTKQRTIEAEAATLPLPPKDAASTPELIFVSSSQGFRLVEIHTGQDRRLMTSEYGHQKYSEQQLRRVTISSAADKPDTIVHRASTQGR